MFNGNFTEGGSFSVFLIKICIIFIYTIFYDDNFFYT